MTEQSMTPNEADTRAGKWIPWAFVLGFVIIFAANAIMATIAIDTFPGLIDKSEPMTNLQKQQPQP